jgi:formylglycine-generating enzyme required for sulfatase activity/serine/threonine protein kinase
MNSNDEPSIPGYRFIRKIGSGGMATVFLARQISLNRNVAIKLMKAALSADEEFSSRFLKEAHTVASLSHPGIISIYDAGAIEFNSFMAMEYIPGGDLRRKLRSSALSIQSAIDIMIDLALALDYAHDRGIVHRDIKPANILFREGGQALVTDFGVAKAISAGTSMTATGLSIGTPRYMSPEQTRGKDVDGRSDLYALGVVFYEMLTAKVPFDGQDSFSVGLKHINEPPPKLPSSLESCQPIVSKLLQKKPADRYQSGFNLASDLKELLGSIRQAERSPEPTKPTSIDAQLQGAPKRTAKKEAIAETVKTPPLRQNHATHDGNDIAPTRISATVAREPRIKKPGSQSVLRSILAVFSLAAVITLVVYWQMGSDEQRASPAPQEGQDVVHTEATTQQSASDSRIPQDVPQSAQQIGTTSLAVHTVPGGANVWLAGERMGESPLVMGEIGYGSYQLALQLDGYQPWSRKVIVTEDSDSSIEVRLTPLPGRLRISTNPAGAQLWIEGKPVPGETPIKLENLDPGTYELLLRSASYQDLRSEVTVAPGEEGNIELSLEPAVTQDPASLSDNDSASNARTVERLLTAARQDVSEGRLASDSGESALAKYQEVLELDRNNRMAQQGINEIRDHYLEAIQQAFANNELDSVERILGIQQLSRLLPQEFERARSRREELILERQSREETEQLVSEIQTQLRRLGQDIQVDGVFGEQTSRMIRAFESASQRETISGRPTAAILAALKSASEWPTPEQAAGIECSFCPEMTEVPRGTFQMGSPQAELDRRPDEGPTRTVQIEAFMLGVHPVTFEQWDACVTDGGCSHRPSDMGWGRGENPVINVHWYDIQEYLDWLRNRSGMDYRLPSEAEWEYAARASTTTRFYTGECITSEQANFNGSSPATGCATGDRSGRITPVGSFPANPWGFFDMHGNVLEWVSDCWNEDYADAPQDERPRLTGDCSNGVLRGGSWYSEGSRVRSASRYRSARDFRLNTAGFRIARDL